MKSFSLTICLLVNLNLLLAQISTPQLVVYTTTVQGAANVDVNNDGLRDIIFSSSSGDAGYRENNGTDVLGLKLPLPILSNYGLLYQKFAAGDFDNDGDEDLLISTVDPLDYYYNNEILHFRNLGGDFAIVESLVASNLIFRFLEVGDIDGDGDLDVLSGGNLDGAFETVFWQKNQGGTFYIGFGVTESIRLQDSLFTIADLVLDDLDGDGDLDVLTAYNEVIDFAATEWTLKVDWLENLGAGVFANKENLIDEPYLSVPPYYYTFNLAIGDYDGDGLKDIAASNRITDEIGVYTNLGSEIFSLPTFYPATDPNYVIAEDADGDGDIDLITSKNSATEELYYLINDGTGNFPTRSTIWELTATDGFAMDYNGDGQVEMVTANEYTKVHLHYLFPDTTAIDTTTTDTTMVDTTVVSAIPFLDDIYKEIALFPNPAPEFTCLELEAGNYDLEVRNSLGELWRREEFSNRLCIKTADWPSGLFLFSVENKQTGELYKARFIR